MTAQAGATPPSPDAIAAAAARLAPHIVRTPTVSVEGARLGLPDLAPTLKLEFLQTSGAFKYRGALNHVAGPGRNGVVTVSSGNHGIALATAGAQRGVRVVVVLAAAANPWRRARMEGLDAEIRVAPDAATAFAAADELAAREGLHFVHPYDGVETLEGTGSLGLEFASQAPELDAVVLSVGGGGLAAGVALGMRARNPALEVFGVEPEGAPTLRRALDAGAPVRLERTLTLADSLAAPAAAPMSFAVCREHLADVALVSDAAIVEAMRTLWRGLRLAVEPSAAAGLAAAAGPLRARLEGRRVGFVLCGANQDPVAQCTMLNGETSQ